MGTSPILVLASVVAVAILAFSAVRALPDPAPVPAAEGPAPSAEASAPAPPAEKPAPAPATESHPAAPEAKAEQLDQLLAPIALYPDALLAQILMAATYPLEIVKADRWLQDPAHANLQGDQLAAALEAEVWDPSVKSLVPFPRILRMMDAELDWTEQLGNVVLAQQADVMDAIQRLRHQAAAAGTLWSNAEQQVTTERQGIVIEPANPEFIYPPFYSPAVYGPWSYPDYPPLDISPDDYGAGSPVPFGIGFGVGFAVVQPLWRWCAFDWAQRRIQLDIEKFNVLNHRRGGVETDTWRHAGPVAAIPRVQAPTIGARASTAVSPSAPPALAAVEPPSRAVSRSPTSAFAPGRRGLEARTKTLPSLAGPRTIPPQMMPPQFPRLMVPRTAHATVWVPGNRAPVEGVSRR